MKRQITLLLVMFSVLMLTDCHKKDMPKPIADNPVTDTWLGKWSGPEGTFLNITGGNGRYKLVIQNLDGPATFDAKTVGNKIQFQRNGVTENIRATNGEETGMKWLQGKHYCLTIRAGEGWCKD